MCGVDARPGNGTAERTGDASGEEGLVYHQPKTSRTMCLRVIHRAEALHWTGALLQPPEFGRPFASAVMFAIIVS